MITDKKLRELITESLQGRQNAHKRALRKDAQAALAGDAFCRKELSEQFPAGGTLRSESPVILTADEARAVLLILDGLSASPRGVDGEFLTDRQLNRLEAARGKLDLARRRPRSKPRSRRSEAVIIADQVRRGR